MADKKQNRTLEETVKEIKKALGEDAIMWGNETVNVDVDAISSGSLLVDKALGIGGYPRGRIIEIYGPESSGKTTLALHAIAEVQKTGGKAAFIDVENAIDPVYAKNLGVNIDDLLLSQPDSGEQALEITSMLVRSGAIDLIIVDSVAALVPQAELDGTMSDNSIGLQARLMSKALRNLAREMNKNKCTVIFINQLREKIGIMFGNPETTTGGRSLRFYASVRIEIRKGEAIKQGTEIVGNKTNVKIAKNKVAPPFKTAQIEIRYGEGISRLAEIIDLGVEYDLLEKSGTWFSYKGEKIGQGKENARIYLKEHPEVAEELEKQIRDILVSKPEEKE
ncbi:MAG: recombinase RecA [Erysipelotrichaceae bacterium]|nr:recombinase RecA [Erysipelotrichaceae bacterium]MBR2544570.1 recombinase RecA [Erysipelotrichaceae bacterium]MBR2700715.1 recombinase RecA [Erysipelotrichaceae bacterium]MBR2745497.1 recombinase RecA [Erysipelotrichaceae bacterium]